MPDDVLRKGHAINCQKGEVLREGPKRSERCPEQAARGDQKRSSCGEVVRGYFKKLARKWLLSALRLLGAVRAFPVVVHLGFQNSIKLRLKALGHQVRG